MTSCVKIDMMGEIKIMYNKSYANNWRNEMKPIIFVSSTFYDLKYVREDLSNFIKSHDFEPILFEDGNIGYTPGIPLDKSCYEAMRSADMVILIIGGHYGSAASGERTDFDEYLSVTRKEFQAAIRSSIPIFAFIDNSVYIEYDIYERNCEAIASNKDIITFCAAKDINVFRFIKEIKSIAHIAITPFNRANDIKDFLAKQWTDMFKTYLSSLKEKGQLVELQGTVCEMGKIIQRMNVMLDEMNKKSIGNIDTTSNTIEKQTQCNPELDRICNQVSIGITFSSLSEVGSRRVFIDNMLSVLGKINLSDIPRNIDVTKGINSENAKKLTTDICLTFAREQLPIHIVSAEIISCIHDLKEHLNSATDREYIISHLIENELFGRLFDRDKMLKLLADAQNRKHF